MTEPGRRPEPELTEPDLPRTAKVRPKALRTGWTTGTCASAAAKAATVGLCTGVRPDTVEVGLPGGERVTFPVEAGPSGEPFEAVVVKDAGDDPDCTDGARMTATVEFGPETTAGPELRSRVAPRRLTFPRLINRFQTPRSHLLRKHTLACGACG